MGDCFWADTVGCVEDCSGGGVQVAMFTAPFNVGSGMPPVSDGRYIVTALQSGTGLAVYDTFTGSWTTIPLSAGVFCAPAVESGVAYVLVGNIGSILECYIYDLATGVLQSQFNANIWYMQYGAMFINAATLRYIFSYVFPGSHAVVAQSMSVPDATRTNILGSTPADYSPNNSSGSTRLGEDVYLMDATHFAKCDFGAPSFTQLAYPVLGDAWRSSTLAFWGGRPSVIVYDSVSGGCNLSTYDAASNAWNVTQAFDFDIPQYCKGVAVGDALFLTGGGANRDECLSFNPT